MTGHREQLQAAGKTRQEWDAQAQPVRATAATAQAELIRRGAVTATVRLARRFRDFDFP